MSEISVLHINTWGGVGGAFIASDRLHRGLQSLGVHSVLAYGRTLADSDRTLRALPAYRFIGQQDRLIERSMSAVTQRLGLNDVGNLAAFALPNDLLQQATVFNFHNLHSNYFSYLALPSLTRRKPAIWTLHDMWSFTGHCAYSYDCTKWQTGCQGGCPYLNTEPGIRRDATWLEWQLKSLIYRFSNLTIVAPSQWLANQARQSMLNRFRVHHIPNGVDLQVYRPLEMGWCRTELGVPHDKKVLLFSAQVLQDQRKGGDLLLKALYHLPPAFKADTVLLTMGSHDEKIEAAIGIPTVHLGYVAGDHQKAIVYSAADGFVFPTRADNLPLVLQESLACGTPMVSFRVGGVPDLVRPGITGYLAEPGDFIDLSQQIVRLFERPEHLAQMRQNCRTIAQSEYGLDLQAQRYLELYRTLLNRES